MRQYGLVYLLLGTLGLGQAAISKSALAAQKPDRPDTAAGQNRQTKPTSLMPENPVITISGLCDNPPADKSKASNCKTVITRAQFEKVVDAVQPGMSGRARREFAMQYASFLVMTKKAEQMGLDKGPRFEEQMKVARIQILTKELIKALQEKTSQISDTDIQEYYHKNITRFETAEMDRIYIPKAPMPPAASDTKLTDADRQQHSRELEQKMKEEADTLSARAAAGEEFTKLQAEAYRVAGIQTPVPNTSIKISRVSLPAYQASAMDLTPGEVSSVLTDPNGYVIYKLKTKSTLSLDQAREQITATLRSQRMQEALDSVQDSVTSAFDESYFSSARPK